jgi:hypothetical protein
LSIAKGSACEADGWLDLLRRTGYLKHEEEQRLHVQCSEVIRMLTAKILDLERRERATGKRTKEGPALYDASQQDALNGPGSGF